MKIMVLNPGSTSTKLAVYDGEIELCARNIKHSAQELGQFGNVNEQLDYRFALVLDFLKEQGHPPESLDCIVSRGGTPPRIRSGATVIGAELVETLRERPKQPHASNLGPMMAYKIACEQNIPAYIYDPITTDELNPYARLWGVKDIEHDSMCHTLNTRAVAIETASELGKSFDEMNAIVIHIGGGNSVCLWSKGLLTDTVTGDSGSFSAERCGFMRPERLIDIYEDYGRKILMGWYVGKGGMVSLLGTNSLLEVSQRVKDGDKYAEFCMNAMAYQISRSIGYLAPIVFGKLDAIIFTGGGAYWSDLLELIKIRVAYLKAPVFVKPGEREMDALAAGAVRVMNGGETAHTYE